jgi:hypothetical protein
MPEEGASGDGEISEEGGVVEAILASSVLEGDEVGTVTADVGLGEEGAVSESLGAEDGGVSEVAVAFLIVLEGVEAGAGEPDRGGAGGMSSSYGPNESVPMASVMVSWSVSVAMTGEVRSVGEYESAPPIASQPPLST